MKTRILIVEDDKNLGISIKNILNIMGYITEYVESGKKSKEILKENFFDIAILDLKLPDYDGIELLSDLKKEYPYMEFIIITAFASINNTIMALNKDAFAFIIKPFEIPYLESIIKKAIENQQLKLEVKKSEEKYRSILENMKDGYFEVDLQGNITFMNDYMRSYLGYSSEDLLGMNYREILEKESINDVFKTFNQVYKEVIPRNNFESQVIRNDGKKRNIEGTVYLKYDTKGNKVGFSGFLQDITERKKAEEALRVKDNAITSSINAIAIADMEGILTYVNPSFLKMWGYSNDTEVLGKNSLDFWQLEDKAAEVIRSIQETGSWIGELIGKKKDDSFFDAQLSASMVMDKNGKPIKMMASFIDITKRKQAEIKLKESEEKYRGLFENSPYSVMLINNKEEIIDYNSRFEKLIGYKKGELIGKILKQLKMIAKEYIQLFIEQYKNFLRGNKTDPIDIKIIKKDKNLIWTNIQFSSIKLGKETFTYVIIQDITERKHSEEELRKLERSLHELNAIIENAPLAICLLNQEGKILRANEETEILFGFKSDKLLNSNIYDLFDSEYLELVKRHYNKDIYDLSVSNKIEVLARANDGNLFHVDLTSTILKIGEHLIIQSYISDITERKQFEINRELLFSQLTSSLEFKSKFLATMSHELRTPLNAILGFSQLLLEESFGEINQDQKEFISDINTAGDHLLSLINTILDISKIEAGKFKLNLKKIKLDEIIEEIKAVIKPLYSKEGLEFSIKGINNDDTLVADPLRFKQILYNLLSNAIKFTEKGNITLIGIERVDHWEFQVKDTGIGIAKKNYNIIFREFGRIENDKTSQIQGFGLGLALTKRLINLHEGEIWFESQLGKGTTFFFTIPKK